MSIIDQIKFLRNIYNLSQAKFAEKIHVSSSNVGEWERGKSLPGLTAISNISNEFSVSIDWLVHGKEVQKNINDENLIKLITFLTKEEKVNLESYAQFLLWCRNKTEYLQISKKNYLDDLTIVNETKSDYKKEK